MGTPGATAPGTHPQAMKKTVVREAITAAVIMVLILFLGSRPGVIYATGITCVPFPPGQLNTPRGTIPSGRSKRHQP